MSTFILVVISMFVVVRVGTGAAEGNPRVVEDGFVTRGGGWIDGRQASWPFVELHVTPDAIELRPNRIRFFAPVRVTREDRPTISTVWSPLGRGIRLNGPTLGRRTTFWPARPGAVLEAMRQLSWPVGETDVEAVVGLETVAPVPVRAERPIAYRCSWVNWLGLAAFVGIVVAVAGLGAPLVFWLLALAIWTWTAATTTYRVTCDGLELRCDAPLWHRRIPVADVLTIQGAVAGRLASGGKTTITPRRGPRM